ncbi:MAG: DUF3068 domain-containing protein [Actinobacteria bacterium]|nr:DUF3068 domain-containing protein [Actinomycetota bacterium]
MKRVLGIVLVGLGAFLLVLAGMLKFYAVPALAKAPLVPGESTGGISTTVAVGTAEQLFDPSALASGGNPNRTNVPLTSTRTTRGDVSASQQEPAVSEDLAIYDSFSNTVDDKGTTISAGTIRVAFNRVTSVNSNCCGANVDGAQVDWTGINPLKFPFDVQQQTYDYFDTTLAKAVPIEFTGTEDLDGLQVYVFKQTIPATQIGEQEVPGSLVGSTEPSVKAPRMYENVRTLQVDPVTGSIVAGVEEQKQWLAGADGSEKVTLLKATVGTDDATKQAAIDDAKANGSLLKTAGTTVPIIALVLGLILLGLGFFLVTRKDDGA